MRFTREAVDRCITSERNYQDVNWPQGQPPLTVGEELLLMEEYIRRARIVWTESADTAEPQTLNVIRKVAGIAVRCMEHHGAVSRAGY